MKTNKEIIQEAFKSVFKKPLVEYKDVYKLTFDIPQVELLMLKALEIRAKETLDK